MKRIPLRSRNGNVKAHAVVDDADFWQLGTHRWSLNPNGYVARRIYVEGRYTSVYLHRVILGLRPGDGFQGDHINGDKLDNRRSNLRVCTGAENSQNTPARRGKRGASWCKRRRRWRAHAKVGGCFKHLGYFDTEKEAGDVAAAFRDGHMTHAESDRASINNNEEVPAS